MNKTLLAALLAVGVSCAPVAQAAVFSPVSFTLANGMRLIVVPNRLSPAVAQCLAYKVGADDEKPGKSGLAHYLEHLMFRGTKRVPAGAFSSLIAAHGGSENAFTSYDLTAFHELVASKDLGLAMILEADRMKNLQISSETATPELSVVLSERDERTDNSPQGLFAEKFRAALYPDSAYGRPVIGHRKDIVGLSPADARAFYRAHYVPNNAVLVVSGDVTPREAVRLADATFGKIPPSPIQKRRPVAKPDKVGASRVVMKDGRVRQPFIEWAVRAPSLAEGVGRWVASLEVLSELLAGGEVGVLYDDLVRKEGLATGLDIAYDPLTRGPTSFVFLTSPQGEVSPFKLEKALKKALRRVARKGFSAKEVEEAKRRFLRGTTLDRDGVMAPCQAFGTALAAGYTTDAIEKDPERIKAVTARDVADALRALAKEKLSVTGFLLPDPAHPAEAVEEAPSLGGKEIR